MPLSRLSAVAKSFTSFALEAARGCFYGNWEAIGYIVRDDCRKLVLASCRKSNSFAVTQAELRAAWLGLTMVASHSRDTGRI